MGNSIVAMPCILLDLAHVLVPARIGRARASPSASLAVLAVSGNETILELVHARSCAE